MVQLNISRPRQGRPVVFQDGTSMEFMDIAAQQVITAPGDDFEYLKAFTAELKRKVQDHGVHQTIY